MNKKLILLFVLSICFIVLIIFVIPTSPHVIRLKPAEAKDSDGNPSSDIIQRIVLEKDFEDVTLKVRPFGYIIVKEWNNGMTDLSNIEKAIINVKWKTDVKNGAGNIYVGYSTDEGKSFVEKGPFNESENIQNSVIKLPKPFTYDLKKVQVRWRGEDLDYRLTARGYVNFTMDVYI
ncbi:MAG: hypothetical protein GTN36_05835 [Candidatus Aenigmarchaeota archaeon]|nr:hypothetical protein [Candidatus Aenigmarchaeota archaeon]